MQRPANAALWIIAVAAIIAGLYWFRDILTQFTLALVLWLVMDGLARWLDEKIPLMPRWLALPIAIALVLAIVAGVGFVVVQNADAFLARAGDYRVRLNDLVAATHASLGLSGPAPTVDALLREANPTAIVSRIVYGLQGIVGDFVFILIYLGFIFAAASQFPQKLDMIFTYAKDRDHAREVFTAIRTSVEKYLWVQTLASLVISALTYATLLWIGLPNAMFWAFLIFFLNYIPTIGSLIAVALPTLFALVHFEPLEMVALTALGVGAWQFLIGNFLQPRMTGESLNLSAVVVLLALAIWGSLWGMAGAFLAAPITVILMTVLAQFKRTRWIAILLSSDGRPPSYGAGGGGG
jgi:predicted PurR-regulated permease PerM